ncbi:Phosphatidylinositol transfer protein [Plasmodium coatneyi]|uniref:Phosphatidylinositol transfer protein n=1 Tax=Plasmodium coatneyi TaxID=208452 RepID=A0A1B1E1R6_9APIC|nr:Phosphatidylinositol transfer protein [Plasmodium coatneyi]ANQ08964.1 Phosphatidylinositol transfer protein [Plasmodium coatneyi]
MKLIEFRLTMPLSVEEYNICQKYLLARVTQEDTYNTMHGEGRNKRRDVRKIVLFKKGTLDGEHGEAVDYTFKRMNVVNKIPKWLQNFVHPNYCLIDETYWNSTPNLKIVYEAKGFPKARVQVDSTHHLGYNTEENPFNIPEELLTQRKIILIDIVNDELAAGDYKAEEDPTLFYSEKAKRGKLEENWIENSKVIITCYKLFTIDIPYFGILCSKLENWIVTQIKNNLLKYHRKALCWIDEWYNLTEQRIYMFEEEMQQRLENFWKEVGLDVENDSTLAVQFMAKQQTRSAFEKYLEEKNSEDKSAKEGKGGLRKEGGSKVVGGSKEEGKKRNRSEGKRKEKKESGGEEVKEGSMEEGSKTSAKSEEKKKKKKKSKKKGDEVKEQEVKEEVKEFVEEEAFAEVENEAQKNITLGTPGDVKIRRRVLREVHKMDEDILITEECMFQNGHAVPYNDADVILRSFNVLNNAMEENQMVDHFAQNVENIYNYGTDMRRNDSDTSLSFFYVIAMISFVSSSLLSCAHVHSCTEYWNHSCFNQGNVYKFSMNAPKSINPMTSFLDVQRKQNPPEEFRREEFYNTLYKVNKSTLNFTSNSLNAHFQSAILNNFKEIFSAKSLKKYAQYMDNS